jgi:hypothetical protein
MGAYAIALLSSPAGVACSPAAVGPLPRPLPLLVMIVALLKLASASAALPPGCGPLVLRTSAGVVKGIRLGPLLKLRRLPASLLQTPIVVASGAHRTSFDAQILLQERCGTS